jgi:apolipoprotein N-acyltransferase
MAFLAGGVPAILAFPGPSLSYLAWFALVPGMVLFTRAPTTREAVARGWWFGAAYLIAMLYWMATEIGPGLLLIGAIFGCMWSPFAVAANRLLKPPVTWPRALAALIVVPSAWLVPEWIRSYQGLGGPWGLYGASQWQHPAVLALASVGGVWLVSVALLIANTGLMLLLGAVRPALAAPAPAPPAPAAPARRRLALAAAGAVALVIAAGSGPLAFALTPAFPSVRQVTIALVQPGVVNDPAQRVDASETLTTEFGSGSALANDHPDLIVWGESSVAYDLAIDPTLLDGIERLSAQDQSEILVSQDSTIPDQAAARRRSPSWSARRASRAVT